MIPTTNLLNARAYCYKGMYVLELFPVESNSPKGLFVFLHGFPGWSTKNYDLAERLCLSGYAVLIPHYPGLGLSKGTFSFKGSQEKMGDFLEFAKKEYALPISLFGHSWGGHLAIHCCRYVEKLLILFAPLSVFPSGNSLRALVDGLFEEVPLDCRNYTPEKMRRELKSLGAALSLDNFASVMKPKALLIIHGTNDKVISLEDSKALMARSIGKADLIEINDDHLLLQHRRKLLEQVSTWVKINGSMVKQTPRS